MRAMKWIPLAALAAIAFAMAIHGPIAQPAGYHDFADTRAWIGMARAADVLSNLPFAIVGLWGLARLRSPRRDLPREAAIAYRLFFIALIATAMGSGYYHLAPDDARLVWDRLPIAVACAALVAAVHAESGGSHHPRVFLAAWTAAAIASVFWWPATGDLRPYLLVQAAPLVLVPLWQWRAAAPRARRIAFGLAIALYVAAKIAEALDRQIYAAAAIVSGHTLKHLVAAAAAALIAATVAGRTARRGL